MNEITNPMTTAPSDVDPDRTPRSIDHAQMRLYQEQRLVTLLSTRDRYRMIVRYDSTWWIGDRDGFTEITSTAQTAKLDRWHERLNNGALWS
ncbi:hypothetical protein BDK92_2687 [Micromonospora pisi]|uniref:Uncharacterized protein n=1 Tax=Micromonospora pisi TaxID=589240 RepID=A0A495JH50_9ACTN|nr:hypothetical protein [Micromonospora pisi]RKR88370.1 hypothetical protein BDK92_2687 [Micromonospora pisi]